MLRDRLSLILCSAFFMLFGLSANDKPNIVFILIDDMPWHGTSVEQQAGNPQSKSIYRITPNVERIAERGMTFSNAYAAAGMCAPSRMSIQTGLSPARHLFSGNSNFGDDCPDEVEYKVKGKNKGTLLIEPSPLGSLNPKLLTVGEALKEKGYATGHFGKWHVYGKGPGANGYDESNGETSNDEGGKEGSTDPKDPKRIFSTTRHSIQFIEKQHKAKKPFFVQVSHYVEHNQQQSLSETFKEFEKLPVIRSIKDKAHRKEAATHGAAVKDLDTTIGTILNKLDELGIRDNTYVIFTSDNGKGLNNGKETILRGDKWWLWEAGIRVPFMIEGPGIKPGSRSSLNVINYDFLPTFYEIATGNPQEISQLDGKSIMPILTDGKTDSFKERALYFHYPHLRNTTPHSAIIKGDYKLFTFYEIPDKPYLYKLSEDVGEEVNLSPQMPEKAQALKKEMEEYFARVGAYLPKHNPDADQTQERFNPDKVVPTATKLGGQRLVLPNKDKKKK
jgi:arylsulfatase A